MSKSYSHKQGDNRERLDKSYGCHGGVREDVEGLPLIALVGNPNVGKSVIFNFLTGRYVTVSNYPGTTVEVSKARVKIDGEDVTVVDTPGVFSLYLPLSEEEVITRRIILEEKPDLVVHVVDAKNLDRSLVLTFQLLDFGMPVVLVLNMIDEAEKAGLEIDSEKLSEILGVPVIETVAVKGVNLDKLRNIIGYYIKNRKQISHRIEVLPLKEIDYACRKCRLNRGELIDKLLKREDTISNLGELNLNICNGSNEPLEYKIMSKYFEEAELIAKQVTKSNEAPKPFWQSKLDHLTMHPIYGSIILLIVLYFFYLFVGVLGAQIVVDYIEGEIFEGTINPILNKIFESIIPWVEIQDLFVHEYGILTLGVRYGVAIIFPVVTLFFIAFSILEDSGYLPRLAILVDKIFKKLGLNGKAVIPLILGFGCDTMATITTRTLETKREKMISTMLLALAIPCSAQLGVIMILLAGEPLAFLLWTTIVGFTLLLVGYLAAKIMPGPRPQFILEIPPFRRPKISNILIKTWARVEWYLKEVLPLFILASVLIWIGRLTGVFQFIVYLLGYPVKMINLPKETAVAILFGFFRRDYGAAGLYDLAKQGLLTGPSLLVSTVVITLFVPCIAQFSIMIKERGIKFALSVFFFNFLYAFAIGGLLSFLLLMIPQV